MPTNLCACSLDSCTTAFDLGDQGSLQEEELFSAIRWCASGELSPTLMNHLRRLVRSWAAQRPFVSWCAQLLPLLLTPACALQWRQVSKTGSGASSRANTEDFLEKLSGDEFLANVLLAEKAIELPKPEGEGGDEEEED